LKKEDSKSALTPMIEDEDECGKEQDLATALVPSNCLGTSNLRGANL